MSLVGHEIRDVISYLYARGEDQFAELVEAEVARVVRLTEALRTLQQWDMLHETSWLDAKWARALIDKALAEVEP